MAIHAHSTPAPGFQRRLLRAARLLAPATAEPTQTPALTAETVALLDAMRPSVEALAAGEEIGLQPCSLNGLGPKQALVRLTAPQSLLPLPAPLPSLSAALSRRRAIFGPVEIDEPATTAQARALHMRRELRKGLDHGLALMDALDLSPRGLDLMDRAIAQLDALEAPYEDLEPWLAGYQNLPELPLDAEDDSEEDEGTSLETFGRGFVRCGADDAEDDDPAERDEDHGSEDEAHPWRCDPSLVAFAVQVARG